MRRARNVLSIPAAAALTFVAVYQLAPIGGAGTEAVQPTTASPTTASPVAAPIATASPARAPIATALPGTAPTVDTTYYAGCNAARAAGAAPIYRGQPGYRVEMDGDL